MGYTHYWDFNKIHSIKNVESTYQKAIKDCNKIIQFYYKHNKGTDASLSGYSAHTSKYDGIKFNGCRGNDCEDFVLRATFNECDGDFCKTRRNYYDIVVVACLSVLKYYLRDAVDVTSDGDYFDWSAGVDLACYVLNKKIKNPIDMGNSLKLG